MTMPTLWAAPPDTGWRDVLTALTHHAALTRLQVRRIGDTVWWAVRYDSTNIKGQTVSLVDSIPAGFRFAPSYQDFQIPVASGSSVSNTIVLTVSGGTALQLSVPTTAAGSPSCIFSYPVNLGPTRDGWPATYPGTSV